MRNQRHPLTELAIISTLGFLSGVSVYPIYLIGVRSVRQLSWFPETPGPEINGAICASLTFPFNFQFAYNDVNSIRNQWRIANRYGKTLIFGSALVTLATAGIANCYYMEGDLLFKLIALFVPAISARAILVDWTLSTHLAIKSLPKNSRYKATHRLYRALNVLIYNLRFNREFQTDFEKPQQLLATEIKAACTLLTRLPGVQTQINSLFLLRNAAQNGLIITDLQHKNPRYGIWLTLIKLAIFSAFGGLAGYKMYDALAPKAGACIFGSRFEHYFDDPNIVCPITNETWESIGYGLGRVTFGILTAITIFPLLELFDFGRVSMANPYECGSRTAFYFFSLLSAICRVSIATYVQTQNSGNNDDYFGLTSVAVVFFFYNYFSMAILGPPTFKTFGKTILSVFKKLLSCCCQTKGAEPLLDKISYEQTITNCRTLLHHCLFTPAEVHEKLLGTTTESAVADHEPEKSDSDNYTDTFS
jgi:hypothetical protein